MIFPKFTVKSELFALIVYWGYTEDRLALCLWSYMLIAGTNITADPEFDVSGYLRKNIVLYSCFFPQEEHEKNIQNSKEESVQERDAFWQAQLEEQTKSFMEQLHSKVKNIVLIQKLYLYRHPVQWNCQHILIIQIKESLCCSH